jgi:hypothetical protein
MHEILNRLVLSLLFSAPLAGCGAGFDPPSEIKSLRVLGVQRDNPYPQPGETVNLRMLWHDGLVDPLAPEEERDVQVMWLTGCVNPASESVYGCFEQFAALAELEEGEAPSAGLGVTLGDEATLTIDPERIFAGLRPPEEGQPVIGRSFVFFTVCAGTVRVEQPRQAGALPLVCRDTKGNQLGPDSFVAGWVTLFTYQTPPGGDPIRNDNPIVTGFQVNGKDVAHFCVDGECLGSALDELPDIDCAATPEICFPPCKDDGDSECPKIRIRPIVDPASAEPDAAARAFFGHDFQEQMWINYYVDRGGVRGDGVRLLNDATKGWNDDFKTDFYAPKDPGPVTVWAVIHDDRGGQSWVRTRLQIEAPEED